MARLVLHSVLLEFADNIYFQPPSNIQLVYPCIIYHKKEKDRKHGNNSTYIGKDKYRLTVIDRDPDSLIPDLLEDSLQYCKVVDHFTQDNLNHTILDLYYDHENIHNLGGTN